MLTNPVASDQPAPQSRMSVLRKRWHKSSKCVTVLAFLILAFANLPGQIVKTIEYKVGVPFQSKSQFEHGWPFTYLVRSDRMLNVLYRFSGPRPERSVGDCFLLWRDCEALRPWRLFANCCVAVPISLILGAAFEIWRRKRIVVWHIHLADLFFSVLAASLVLGWYVQKTQQYTREHALFQEPRREMFDAFSQRDEEGGITWLRMVFGEKTALHLDRPFEVVVWESDGWSLVGKATSVRHVHACHRASTEEMSTLATLPKLEALSLEEVDDQGKRSWDDLASELPPLPKLRGLYLSLPANRCRRIDRLTSLEALRITEGCIDEHALREVSALKSLRELALNGLSPSDDVSFLRSLPRLTDLDLHHGDLSNAALRNIGACQHLKSLSLHECDVDARGVRYLSGLALLESLDLGYTNVRDRDLADLASLGQLRELKLASTKIGGDLRYLAGLQHLESLNLYGTKTCGADLLSLVGLRNLRELDLGSTNVGKDGAAHLRQMRQLQWLRISNFGDRELRALRDALPDCEVVKH